ncbi:odorant receptor 33c [Drosophila busckii]|uniref:odorant receptor 33c n=1 Tax=Drosophila busckii TaxID=30019 RepID=UPI001432F57C|nr:odorant receptor 33c [Drosophila busckii]
MTNINSRRAYLPLWFCFHCFAGAKTRVGQLLRLLLHLLVTVMFPLHLLLGLVLVPATATELFKNMTMSFTCVACSLKHLVQIYHLPQMLRIEQLLQQLDACVLHATEQRYFKQTLQLHVRCITRGVYVMYFIIYLAFALSVATLLHKQPRELLYHAWFPFEWQRSSESYALAFGFQICSILFEGLQGLTNDVYTPLTLCYLGGHAHMLAMRLSRLGFDQSAEVTTDQQLLALHKLAQQTISYVQLVQLLACGASLCIIVSYVLFYVRDVVGFIYNIIYIAVVLVQLFPSCYYASVLHEQEQRLTYAIFSSNWYEQSPLYRRRVLIFMQLTLALGKRPMRAAGLIELNLNAFFATVKMAYSLFAVIVRVKV